MHLPNLEQQYQFCFRPPDGPSFKRVQKITVHPMHSPVINPVYTYTIELVY